LTTIGGLNKDPSNITLYGIDNNFRQEDSVELDREKENKIGSLTDKQISII
jgi:hypothetical protein